MSAAVWAELSDESETKRTIRHAQWRMLSRIENSWIVAGKRQWLTDVAVTVTRELAAGMPIGEEGNKKPQPAPAITTRIVRP